MSNKPIKLWQYLVPIVVLLAIWFYPVPEGLKPQAWHMFAISQPLSAFFVHLFLPAP